MNEAGEAIVYQGRPSWLNYIGLYVAGIALFSLLSLAGRSRGGIFALCFMLGVSAIFRFRYLFTCTEQRIITREGLVARNTNEMQLRHIRAINVRQGVIERILGIGTIIFISAVERDATVVFKGIWDPQGMKERIRSVEVL